MFLISFGSVFQVCVYSLVRWLVVLVFEIWFVYGMNRLLLCEYRVEWLWMLEASWYS